MKNVYYSVLNWIFDEVIVHVLQIFKTMEEFISVELLIPKPFYAREKNPMEAFSILNIY